MRALHFVQSLEPLQGGGLGSSALQLHQEMQRRGGSTLMTTRSAAFQDMWPGVYQCVRRGPSALFYADALAELAGNELMRCDWVHAHGLYVYTNYLFSKEARRRKKPLVTHIHGILDPWILKRSRWKKCLVNFLFQNRSLRESRFLRALTEKEAGQIRSVGLKNPIAVVPNGIELRDVDQIYPEEPGGGHFHRKRPRRVLFLSRIHPKKGLDILIPVWAKLARRFPDWELAIVGPDEAGYQLVVESMIRSLAIDDCCTIFPAVSGAVKHQVYRSADIFVLPSYSEGFPMAVLEALAHRIPVVLTTECNVPELAREGAAWECLPTFESLFSALELALSADELELRQHGEMGRKIVESRFTWTKAVDLLEAACLTYQ